MRLVRQLDGSRYASANCGPVATAHALRWSTRGRLRPDPAEVRRRMDGQWVGPDDATSLSDNARAWETFRNGARREGLDLPEFRRFVASDSGRILEALDRGKGVIVQIDHRVLNSRRPDLSGDRGFMGLHVVFIPRARRRQGGVEVLVYDGLYDGRQRGTIRYPEGPQWWPLWVLIKCAEARVRREIEGSVDRATFAVIDRAGEWVKPEPVPEPTPEPQPEPTCEERLDEALAQRDAAREEATVQGTMLRLATEEREKLEDLLRSMRTGVQSTAEVLDALLASIDEAVGPPLPDAGQDPAEGVGEEKA